MYHDGSASLLSQQAEIQSDVATDDLLGLDQPAAPLPQAYDPFADMHSTTNANDFDINSLANELTRGALELEVAKSMQLNDAFLSLEKMRQANLEIEFGHSIGTHQRCVQCIRALPPNKRPSTPSPYRIMNKVNPLGLAIRKHKPCLLCGAPTCQKHSDEAFKKSKLCICKECSPLFSLDFIIDCISHKYNTDDPEEAARLQRHQIKHMIDVYDRVLLMLEYSGQFIDEIATTLEESTKKEDKIGLGCNFSGVTSGLAGVAAAACFVTPAGPPLLIASLLFSGAAQMTSSGSKMVNYYSTPNKIAFKIISLYNLCKSVLMVTTVLRDALLKDHINLEKYVENMIKETEEAVLEMKTGFEDDELEDETTGLDEEDDDDGDESDDDASWMSGAPQQSNRFGLATGSDITEPPLAKIDEGIASPGFQGMFANENGSSRGLKDDSGSARAAKPKTDGTIVTPDPLAAIVMVASKKIGLFSKKAQNTKTKTPSSPEKTRPSDTSSSRGGTSPTKQEQIDDLKKTNHFMERDDNVGKLARFYSRGSLAGTSLLGAATVTVMAGAALSFAHVAFEANNLAATIKRIQAGSPSKRAKTLRVIKDDIKNLPITKVIVEEWEKYLEVLVERQNNNDAADMNGMVKIQNDNHDHDAADTMNGMD